MVNANQVTNSLKLFGITFQVFFFVREGPADRFDELRIPHCIIVCFSFIVDRVKSSIVQAFYFQLVHDTEIAEILVHHLTLIQASYIMNTRIQQMPFSLVSLEASAELRIFFYYAYVESLFAKNRSAFQSAKAAADNDDVIFAHTNSVF